MSLLAAIKGKGKNGFGYGSTAEDVTDGVDLSGKTFVVTGCNSGIGLESMRVLALRGAHVIAAARTVEKATAAGASVGADVTPVACELSEPASVRAAADTIRATGRKLSGILCNAGIMALPKLTLQHGYDLQFFTNHVGHFILVTNLLDALAEDGRVVMTSSDAHKQAPRAGVDLDNLDGSRGYSSWRNYGQSKFCNILFAKALAKRFEGTSRTANAVHPGVIHTNLARHMNPLTGIGMTLIGPVVLKTIPQGAATQVYVAANPGAGDYSGEYFKDCNVGRPRSPGEDHALAERLWEKIEAIVAGLPG
jgi:NAD(P)-dependent dehydrogenase (short-subunit alcohol dehydrogenase family)